MIEHAKHYLNAGLSVLPAKRQQKYPALSQWKPYQLRLPTLTEINAWFSNPQDGLCIVAGAVSGNLEMIDFDNGGELFDAWYQQIDAELVQRLVIEQSPSGGWHVVYRCQDPVSGSIKLAERKDGSKIHTLIETRGEGGLFLCAPTAGYELKQGAFDNIPLLTAQQRESLLEAAWALNEYFPEPVEGVTPSPGPSGAQRPGDDYNARGDVRALLQSHGWTCVKGGDNEYWRRPDKTTGWSATLKNNVFYVWSTNASPFEPKQPYAPFSVYAILEHGGDFSKAAAELAKQGYGDTLQHPAQDEDVDISAITGVEQEDEIDDTSIEDPGPLPKHLLSIPGLINEVSDFMLQTAPHPEPILSFFGAVCLQAFLAGRKVRDSQDNRTNLYILGLAYPGCGKDHPRKVNIRILHEAGFSGVTADGFASGEGIEDKMFLNPSMLFQTDEIDTIITATSKGKDSRIDMITNVLLKMFSASNAIYQMRVKAGKKENDTIDQPSLNVYGTAVPENYYQALSSKMLTNGFFARMLVVESGPRTPEQDHTITPIPDSICRVVKHWAGFSPGEGNLSNFHPVPIVVAHTEGAKAIQREYGKHADAQYDAAQQRADLVTMAIWGRASEKARRLALIYACSENALHPQITEAAVHWATELVDYTTRRMLFMASQYVSESDFHAQCQKLLRVLREWKTRKGNIWMPYFKVSQKLPWSERDHVEVRTALLNQRRIDYIEQPTRGTPKRLYRLVDS